MRRVFGAVIAAAAVVAVLVAYLLVLSPRKNGSSEEDRVRGPLVIGLSLASHREARWEIEADIMKAKAKEQGVSLLTAVADGDSVLQEKQALAMMDEGATVLIVVANDAEKAAAIVEEAHGRGVKVIAYDRLIRNTSLDYYLSFDNYKVGEFQAKGVVDAIGGKGSVAYIGGSPTDNNATLVRNGSFSVLQPKIDSGEVKVVLDKQVPDWNADIAYDTMFAFLKRRVPLDGVVVANDGMAQGVIRALKAYGLAGKVPVSGQDVELAAARSIVAGDQTLTVYKPLKKLAEEAVTMAIAVAQGELLRVNATVDNGGIFVPSRLLNVIMVTKDNLDATVIADGFLSRDDVYGPAH